MATVTKICGTCKFWTYNPTNPDDRKHEMEGRRFCWWLNNSAVQRATSFSSTTPACNKHRENIGDKRDYITEDSWIKNG